MEYELIINPTQSKHYPKRYKAVLLLNGILSKGYPKEMKIEQILNSVYKLAYTYTNGMIKLKYNHER